MRFLYILLFTYSFAYSVECTVHNSDTHMYIYVTSRLEEVNRATPENEYVCGSGINLYTWFKYTNCSNTAYNKKCTMTQYQSSPKPTCLSPKINNPLASFACQVPPTCSENEFFDVGSWSCATNECDYKHPDFLNLDCDGDGVLNGSDDDIDGDGTPNKWDADSNGDGIADSSDPNSPTYDNSCSGPDTSEGGIPYGSAYPLNNYNYKGAMLPTSCNNLVDTDVNVDSSLVINDINKECMTRYCYVHVLKSVCNFWGSDFIPDGSNWIISTIKNEQQCSSAVDGTKYLEKHWAMPDPTNCPMDKWCYLQRNSNTDDLLADNNTEKDDETMEHPDLNSTSSELSPLLNAANTTNKHLQDLKDKTDVTNASLTDLKDISNKTLNNNIEMKSSLSALKSNSDKSLANDLQSITSLSSINTGLQNANAKISLMSTSITSNQNTMQGSLTSMDGKLSTTNNLLTDIKGLLGESGSDSNGSSSGGLNNASLGEISSNTKNTSDRLANIQDEILKDYGIIQADEEFDSSGVTSTLESSLNNFIFDKTFFGLANISTGSIPTFQVNVLNKTITIFEPSMLNGLPIVEIRSLIALMFALVGFAHTFRSV